MKGWWRPAGAAVAFLTGLALAGAGAGGAAASTGRASPADQASVCAAPPSGYAHCGAIQLIDPAQNWHAGRRAAASPARRVGGSSVSPPSSGYYPADLLSAYGLASAVSAAATTGPGPTAPTVAIVDAYDDPYAASDLAAYRSALNGATDPATGLSDVAIPPLCSSDGQSGCIKFTKVNQIGGTSYPRGSSSWSEEISLDLDMISAVCPDCNITLVEASSASFTNLDTAVAYAKGLKPAAVTNSYGGSEFSSETAYDGTYSASGSSAVTAASGDSGYGVEYPAASPDLTAVGGTSLRYIGSGSGISWSQSVWSGAGAGCSLYEPMPTWQAGSGYSISTVCASRQVADVSAVADPNTGVAVYDTYSEPGWMVFGGTSVSTQVIGALYGLAGFSAAVATSPGSLYGSSGLVPVASGSDGSCGDYLCDAANSLSTGYNGPAGLGSPEGIGAFTGAPAPPGFSLSVSPPSTTVTPGSSATYTVTVSDTGGFAGSVALSASGGPTDATYSFNPTSTSTSSTLTVTTGAADSGSYTITIAGTASGVPSASSTAGLTIQAAPTNATMTVTVTAGSVTAKHRTYRVPITVDATDASSGAPLAGAGVTLAVYSGTSCSGTAVASGSATTGTSGAAAFTFSTRSAGTYCALATVTDAGYTNGSGQTTFST